MAGFLIRQTIQNLKMSSMQGEKREREDESSKPSSKHVNPMEELNKKKAICEALTENMREKQKEVTKMLMEHRALELEMSEIYERTQKDKYNEYMRLEKDICEKKAEMLDLEKKNCDLKKDHQQLTTCLETLKATLLQIAEAIKPTVNKAIN
jgi:chromosome segregation ATPase